jgi:RND family efflux transporter MFP subunit
MIRKYVMPLVALAGIGLALFTVVKGRTEAPPVPPVATPAVSPYDTFVAGAGLIEPRTEIIAIGTSIAGVVTRVNVEVGTFVPAGTALFEIDDRQARADVAVRRAEVEVAEAARADVRNQLRMAESVRDKRALSIEELDRRRFAAALADARVLEAVAQLEAAETNLNLLTVRAPVDGQVLQVNVRVGEFAPTGVVETPLVLLGDVATLHVRVDVDETEAWRVQAGAAATAVVRGNPQIRTPLRFVRFEPYIIPKRSLTGESTERVDTRVLQVIYSFERGELPVFVGQQMDVFIEAPGHAHEART